ncbi:hypothetical protein GOV14_01650 [Candidatus Pacearchaeota archaeon]|nr:hypothetical protein [Candidatus Pacearchaeota archaeon]
MKAWLKGGLIAAILDIVLVILAIVSSNPKEAQMLALGITQFPFTGLIFLLGSSIEINSMITVIIGGLVTYFIIGALIGLLIHKIRSKK